jgi:hypothetical protein
MCREWVLMAWAKLPALEAPVSRQRRWLLLVLGVVAVLALGLGTGSAYAYFTSHGSGSGQATIAGSPTTIMVTATSSAADLLPGSSGKTYFTLTNSNLHNGASFSTVTAASVSSTSSGSCPASNISFPSFPYSFSPAVTVNANAMSGTQSIAGLVTLSSSAPNACQGVTFTVTLTLSGRTT